MCGRARQRAARTRKTVGGFTFAEDPTLAAPQARLIWHARLDPGTLPAAARPAVAGDPDALDPGQLAPWLTLVTGDAGHEHCALSDGLRRIRLDVASGTLRSGPVVLHYRLAGRASLTAKILPLRRFVALCTHKRFLVSLFPPDPLIPRCLAALRVHDALAQGASHREIGAALFGTERVRRDWHDGSDSLRSRVRRLVREARAMARGGYRQLLSRQR